jgi:hypothetical protein
MQDKLSVAFAQASAPAEIGQLATTILKVQPELAADPADNRPDPAAIVAYVASFAGMPPEQVAQELGGVEFIARKLAHVTKIPPREYAEAFIRLAREKDSVKATA